MVPSIRHKAGSGVGIGVAAGFGLGVFTSMDTVVGSDGEGPGVPEGVGTGVGGSVALPACGLAETDPLCVALDVALGVAFTFTFA
jgi:hypothetical protein